MDACSLRLSCQNHTEKGSQGRKLCLVATPNQKPQDGRNPQGSYEPTTKKCQVHQNPFRRMPRGGGAAKKENERHLRQDLRHA